jgi:hypothetical protein
MIDSPVTAVSVLAAVWALLAATVKALLYQFEKRLDARFEHTSLAIDEVRGQVKKVDEHNSAQDSRLGVIEMSVREHVAAGIGEIRAITGSVERTERTLLSHIEKEEGQTWVKLDGIKDGIAALALSNEQAHAALVERVAKTESKLPNGDLTTALKALVVALGPKRR